MNNNILVSISCITYNHEKFIEKTIKSFLMQKTNFKFEILIHDDASTDKTQEIIKKYEKEYPNIIKPIYQKENQYSNGVKRIAYLFNDVRANGKYIAICEGDDYWIDPYKLQKQVDLMEKRSEISMCFHSAKILNNNIGKIVDIERAYHCNTEAKISDIILCGGGFCPTASILYRKKFVENMPELYFKAHVGDYPLQMIMASRGIIFYIDEAMSIYRTNVKGSWTEREFFKGKINEKIIENNNKDIELLNDFNLYTNGKYFEIIKEKILNCRFNIKVASGDINTIKSDEYIKIYKNLSKKEKIKIYLRKYTPTMYEFLYKFKRKVKK